MIKSAKVLVAYEASHPSALDRQISVPTPGDNAGTSLFRAGYGSAGSITDSCGQVASLIDSDGGSTHVADYLYLGLGTVVQQDSPQANLRYTLIDLAGSNDPDTGDIYAGLDRFSRIKDLRWRSTSATVICQEFVMATTARPVVSGERTQVIPTGITIGCTPTMECIDCTTLSVAS